MKSISFKQPLSILSIMECGLNKISLINNDNSISVREKQSVHLYDLPDGIIRHILFFLPEGKVLYPILFKSKVKYKPNEM